MAMWEPWRGCHRYSEGCRYCYIHKGDAKRGVDTSIIEKTAKFAAPVERDAKGSYRMKPNQTVYVCFHSDFLLEEADEWRAECWQMMRERSDLHFLFISKRITRLPLCLPEDWGDGYDNVTIGGTCENQQAAQERLPVLLRLPIKHRNIICQPMIGEMDLSPYLTGVELVMVGGEQDCNARVLEKAWVDKLRAQSENCGVTFNFRQKGTHFHDGTAENG